MSTNAFSLIPGLDQWEPTQVVNMECTRCQKIAIRLNDAVQCTICKEYICGGVTALADV